MILATFIGCAVIAILAIVLVALWSAAKDAEDPHQ